MINKHEKTILNKLLDKYEKSKSFIGENKKNQRFCFKVASQFPKYLDHDNYELFVEVNEAINVLVRKGLIESKCNSSNVYNDITLNISNIEQSYNFINRIPKQSINNQIIEILNHYEDRNNTLHKFCSEQKERIEQNKHVQFFNGDLNEFENILIAADELYKVEDETFMRDFSARVFKNSKTFEAISTKVVNLLFDFGNFPDKEEVLGSLNIVKNPTYVNFKGSGIITISDQIIDLNKLNSDIAISSSLLADVENILVTGKSIITIENLTSFNSFKDRSMFAIYLGGYHNKIRRDFIKKISLQNKDKEFLHFGDIDAGGFYILEHLKRETGVDFKPFKMNLETLVQNFKFTKPLTDNDRARLLKLNNGDFSAVITYMIEKNCKLEQEAINLNY